MLQGKILKREHWRFWNLKTLPGDFDQVLISLDPNIKETEHGSEAVAQAWGRVGPDFYLLDRIGGRWEFSDLINNMRYFCWKHPRAIGKLFEDTANGPAVMSLLKRELGGIIPISPKGKSKELRAKAIQPVHVSGNIYIPEDKLKHPWVDNFIRNCAEFPHGDEMDDVDTMTQVLNWWLSEDSTSESYEIGFDEGPNRDPAPKDWQPFVQAPHMMNEEQLKKIVRDGDMTYERVTI